MFQYKFIISQTINDITRELQIKPSETFFVKNYKDEYATNMDTSLLILIAVKVNM